jgi:hypothetical protein
LRDSSEADDGSLLTDAVRALIGRESAPRSVRVEPLALQRLMEALGETRPLDVAAGDQAPVYALALLQPEAEALDLPVDLPGSLVAGDEWEIARPLLVGEPLTVLSRVLEISERLSGRHGQMLYLRFEWRFLAADGALVATARRILGRYRSNAQEQDDG